MPDGLTFNCSMVRQADGFYEVGVRYSDTDNIDIDILAADDDMDCLLEDLVYDFIEEYLIQSAELNSKEKQESEDENVDQDAYVSQLEQLIEDLTVENNSLKTDLTVLQRRVNDAVNENQKQKDATAKYLEAWLKSLR